MAKTTFLQIRCSPEDKERMALVAEAEHLDISTWARRLLLQAVDRWETRRSPALRMVAEKDRNGYTAKPPSPKSGDKTPGPGKPPLRKG